MANALILQYYIKTRREQGKPYNVVSFDVRKAFDSVSHHSIERALKISGAPDGFIKYIINTLDSTTKIKVGEETTKPIQIKRGVKQGNPLSPILFNIIMNELLVKLNNGLYGGSIEDNKCAVMAFADELVKLEDNGSNLSLLLAEIERFLKKRGILTQKNAVAC